MKQTFTSKRSWLLGTAALALAITPMATAQDAPAEDEDELVQDAITVTGIRASIASSLAEKKNNTSLVEAITAEDIGKLPDLSIADSLARLPGVTAQRVRGRAQQVSIRGLGPDFSLALLNGREVVSAGNNRGIEFDQFPSELISKGIVYKSPDATLAATGIAGAVDLQTVRPLDYTERKINLSGTYVFNDQDQLNPDFDETGYRLFGSYIDQNEAGTIGWYIGGTIQSNPTQFTSRELKTGNFQTSFDDATGLIFPSDNPRTGVVSREFERTSIAGALQFEPTGNFRATLDGFYTDTEDAGIFRGVETPLASWSNTAPQPSNITGSGEYADSVTFSPTNIILRTDEEGNTAEIFAVGLNLEYDVNDKLTLKGDLSTSQLDRNDIDYESYAGTGSRGTGPTDTLTYDLDPDGEYRVTGLLDYTDPDLIVLTDPQGWGQVGFIKEPKIDDELTQLRLEAEYEVENDFISGVQVGVLASTREKNFDSNEAFLREGPNFVNGELALSGLTIGETNDGGTGLPIVAYNTGSLISGGVYNVEKATFDTEWSVSEDITTFYAMANIDTMLGSAPVRGNVGFQYVDTTQESSGTLNFGGNQFLQTVEESYGNFLPSANLSIEIQEDTFVRFAAARTLTRPRLDQLAANQSLNTNNSVCIDTDADQLPDTVIPDATNPNATCFSLGGGNPFLQPYMANSFDVAFEQYFGESSAFSIAAFHKELEDWVVDQSTFVDGSQIIQAGGLGDFLAANPEVARTSLGGPVNFADGSITGLEITLRLSLDEYLPESLEGFGFNASYTIAENELQNENGTSIEIPGYSNNVWSGDIYYENYGFRAKVSARNRSDFLSEIQNFDGSLSGSRALDETIVDMQIGYEWDSGPLEGFGINLEAYNLTDEPFVTEDRNDAQLGDVGAYPSRHELYGTTYNLKVTKSF